MYQKTLQELAKRGFQRTVAQCRAKVKVLRKKYKEIVDSLRRCGAGRESDDEVDIPTDFPYFGIMDAILGGRASMTPLHLLNSANSISSLIAEEDDEPLDIIPSGSSTPLPSESTSTIEPPGSSTDTSTVEPPGSSTNTSTVEPAGSPANTNTLQPPNTSTIDYPGPPSSTSTLAGEEDEPVPKKKRKRPTNVQRAEKVAGGMVKELLKAQSQGRKRREKMERQQDAREENREKRELERDQQYMDSISWKYDEHDVTVHRSSGVQFLVPTSK